MFIYLLRLHPGVKIYRQINDEIETKKNIQYTDKDHAAKKGVKKMNKKVSISIIIILMASLVLVAQEVGMITYMEGEVEVSRDGQYLEYEDIDIGLELFDYDIVETGFDGYVEIEITGSSSRGATVKVHENTVFYFQTAQLANRSETGLKMIVGSLSLKVNKLANSEALNVYTQSAIMGVRGTEFQVNLAPDDSLLVTCEEGKVACTTDSSEWYSQPGQLCEWNLGESFKVVDMTPDNLKQYKRNWFNNRIDMLKINALPSIQFYYEQYNTYKPRFDEALKELKKEKEIFDRWSTMLRTGSTPTMGDATKDKIAISNGIVKLRSALYIFEQAYYTLATLEMYHQQGYGVGKITRRVTTEDFYKDFNKKTFDVASDMIRARHYLRIFREISQASSISGTTDDGFDGNSLIDDMFSGSNSPF